MSVWPSFARIFATGFSESERKRGRESPAYGTYTHAKFDGKNHLACIDLSLQNKRREGRGEEYSPPCARARARKLGPEKNSIVTTFVNRLAVPALLHGLLQHKYLRLIQEANINAIWAFALFGACSNRIRPGAQQRTASAPYCAPRREPTLPPLEWEKGSPLPCISLYTPNRATVRAIPFVRPLSPASPFIIHVAIPDR